MSTLDFESVSRKKTTFGSLSFHFFPSLLTLLLFISGVSAGLAASAGIQDGGLFFSDKAKTEASRVISELQRKTHRDLDIETFSTLPDDLRKGLNLSDKDAVSRVVDEWTAKQARQKGLNGIYILIVKEPARLRVTLGNDTQKEGAFSLADKDNLIKLMLAKLRAKQNDEALLDGVNFISSTIESHAGSRHLATATNSGQSRNQPEPRGSSFGWLLPLLLIVVGGWIVMGLIRSIFGSRGGYSGGGGYPGGMSGPPAMGGGGGGGFFRSMLGGMFGAAAGMWMYDNFFGGRGSSSSWGGDSGSQINEPRDSGYTGQDTDYSVSGGSFDDDSSNSGSRNDDNSGASWSDDSGGSGGGFGGGDDSGGGGDF